VPAGDVIWRRLDFAENTISGVVVHHIDASKRVHGLRECGLDGVGVGDLERKDNQLRGWVLRGEIVEGGSLARCGADFVALRESTFDDGFTKA
jgi:hypothetical protein